MIPEAAVEAAVEAAARAAYSIGKIDAGVDWDELYPTLREVYVEMATLALEAAAPHMLSGVSAQVWDEAMTRAAEIAWEHDASASSAITTTPNPYRPTQ